MMPLRSATRAGYALADIAVSFMVVALLIGLLLMGNWYVQGAQMRDVIAQYESFETAVGTFKTKYGALPGDIRHTRATEAGLTALVGGEGQGDGDGLLEGSGGGVSAKTTGAGETTLFWRHLTEAHLLRGDYDGAQVNGDLQATFPRATTGMGGWAVLAGSAATDGQGINFYQLGRPAFRDGGVIETHNTIGPREAHAFDLKIDDGLPAQGSVVARGGNRLDTPASHESGYALHCLTAPYASSDPEPEYDLSQKIAGHRSCQLRVRFRHSR